MTDLLATQDTTSEPGAPSTSSRGTRILGVATLVSWAVLFLFSFVITNPDRELGESIRIMYVHVATILVAYVLMFVNAGASVWYLRRRNEFADVLAHASGEIATVLLFLTLVSGALWGRITWGAYWVWDARLTTTALLFLMYLGYLAVRSVPADPRARGTRSAIVAIAAICLVPVVHKSVDWWSSLHQGETLGLKAKVSGTQLFTLVYSFVPFLLLAAWLLIHRFRVGWLAERAAEHEIDLAIAERRTEAGLGAGPVAS
jgi:heme exporter protein C